MKEIMEQKDMLAVNPKEYLKEGLLTKKNELREGVNGEYSLAMAYRALEEGTTPETAQKVAEELEKIGSQLFDRVGDEPDHALDAAARSSLSQLAQSPLITSSRALSELMQAAQPHLKRLRDLAALSLHVNRIAGQIALVRALKSQKRD